jgi:hypothetical protein
VIAPWHPKMASRWVWALPALVSGLVTGVLVLVLDFATGGEGSEFPRVRIASPSTSVASSAAPTTARPALTLASDGLWLVGFGQPAQAVVATMTSRLGPAEEDADQPCENDPAGHSRWVRWADLSIRLDAHGFAGYIEGVHFPPGRAAFDFATARGLSPGDSAARLRQLYGGSVRVRTEAGRAGRPATEIFTISGQRDGGVLSGVIEKQGNSATVTAIFAGELC